MNKIYQIIAKMIPSRLRYFITIDAWAKATTGEYSKTDATEITAVEVLNRM